MSSRFKQDQDYNVMYIIYIIYIERKTMQNGRIKIKWLKITPWTHD